MLKLCLIRGCRILLMLVIVLAIAVVIVFSAAPDVDFLERHLEIKTQQKLQAKYVDISKVSLYWDAGPAIDVGEVNIVTDKLSVLGAQVHVSYPLRHLFQASLASEIVIQGGKIKLNLDKQGGVESSAANTATVLKNVQFEWVLNQEKQTLNHVEAHISPYATEVSLQAEGIHLNLTMDDNKLPEKVDLFIDDFSMLPLSWIKHTQGLGRLNFSVQRKNNQAWDWSFKAEANQGLFMLDKVHVNVPFETFSATGDLEVDMKDELLLHRFRAHQLTWKDGENFGDFNLQWLDGLLHLNVMDGSATMPMLWSWLWMLGGDEWHQWLSSMQHGRLNDVQGTLELVWQQPFKAAPTHEALLAMKYHVTTQATGADIALGLTGDYLSNVDAEVEVDETHLQAKISSAELQNGAGVVFGDYAITWDTLIMAVEAVGQVDVGRLHSWLEPVSAAELHWQEAPASATVSMLWDLNKTEPDNTVVHFKSEQKPWKLAPKLIPMVINQGIGIWDLQRGLDLTGMHVKTPWFQGYFAMFLDKNKAWKLENFNLKAEATLSKLADEFSLPITKANGQTPFEVSYAKEKWQGQFDLSANTWESFAGYKKEGLDSFVLAFSGQPTTSALLPIHINQMQVAREGFHVSTDLMIDADKLDFHFKDIYTSAIQGNLRLLMPLDTKHPWGIEADTSYLDKRLFDKYMQPSAKNDSPKSSRPWSIFAETEKMVWDKSTVHDAQIKFFSDIQSQGSFKAASAIIGQTKLENLHASFTLLEHGKIDLHHLEADGSDQHITVSGSVKPTSDETFTWRGLTLLSGKFGTLMKQAELDQLFQEGDMRALFLGTGAFKFGEPWWRGMKGSLRLRVDDGRIMEGGTLTRLLAAISLVDLPKYLVFQRGDIVGEGLLYDTLQLEAAFDANALNIKELAFSSSALDAGGQGTVDLKTGELDVLLIARPWQNIEAIIGSIPLLGSVLTGEDKSLMRKVYRIHGPASDANVDEVEPEDVGLPASGYLEDLFTPSKWFEPRKKAVEK